MDDALNPNPNPHLEKIGRLKQAFTTAQENTVFVVSIYICGSVSHSYLNQFDPSVERDRSERNIGVQNSNKFELPGTAHLLNFSHMPHRVESLQMSSLCVIYHLMLQHPSDTGHYSHGRDYNNRHGYSAPSPPPPIATLPHSPSPSASSLDQSATSSPHPSRRPLPRSSLDSTYSDQYYPQEHPPHRQSSGPYPPHSSARNANTYPYPPRPTYDHRYNSSESVNSYQVPNPYPQHVTVPSMSVAPVPSMRNPYAGGPQQYVVDVNFTDDATTKLSDRMRRRCFNCCTTDTSTWRRSNLSPGKVVCFFLLRIPSMLPRVRLITCVSAV